MFFLSCVERFYEMKQCPGTYFVIVIEDVEKSEVVGAATLIVEQKFIHNAANVSGTYSPLQLGCLYLCAMLFMFVSPPVQ